MNLLFCPGYHDRELAECFLADLDLPEAIACHCYPAPDLPPYSPHHILQFIKGRIALEGPLFAMGFSAGVVGAIAAARQWQKKGGTICGLIAIDGWGVPLFSSFPCYRISPDRFSHATAQWLGTGCQNFYADPPVSHLDLLRSPQALYGWSIRPGERSPQYQTMADFLRKILIVERQQATGDGRVANGNGRR